MSEELENKKPKATLIKHPKVEPPVQAPVEAGDAEKRKAVVVVKKKTVVKKKVVAHKDETASVPSAQGESVPRAVAKPEAGESKLSPDKIAEFMSKRPQEMRRIDPSVDRPKPEGLRIESARPPRTDRPQGDRGSRSWSDRSGFNTQQRPQENRSGGPGSSQGGPRPWGGSGQAP